MDEELRRLIAGIDFNGPVEESQLVRAEDRLGYRFPSRYREFLLETGGGAGPLGEEGWVDFHSVRELLEANESAQAEGVPDQFDGLVVFAGDGGGETYSSTPPIRSGACIGSPPMRTTCSWARSRTFSAPRPPASGTPEPKINSYLEPRRSAAG